MHHSMLRRGWGAMPSIPFFLLAQLSAGWQAAAAALPLIHQKPLIRSKQPCTGLCAFNSPSSASTR